MNVTVDDVKNMVEISKNKNKEFVVYVPNKMLYDKLMKMFGELGIKWRNTESPTTKNYFTTYKTTTPTTYTSTVPSYFSYILGN